MCRSHSRATRAAVSGSVCLLACLAVGVAASGCGHAKDYIYDPLTETGAGGEGASTVDGGSGGVGGAGGSGGASDGGGDIHLPVTAWFVDPATGNDDQSGSQAHPFRTVKQALSVAESGHTVWLESGIYWGNSGEDWHLQVPAGVRVAAAPGADVLWLGDGVSTALTFRGDSHVEGIQFHGFATALRATVGAQALSNVKIASCSVGIEVLGSATMTADGLTVAVEESKDTVTAGKALVAGPGGAFTATNTTIEGNAGAYDQACDEDAPVLVHGGAKVTLANTMLANFRGAVHVAGGGLLTLDNSTVNNVGTGTCAGFAALRATESGSLTLQDTVVASPRGKRGVVVANATLTMEGSTVALSPGPAVAVYVDEGGAADVKASWLTGQGAGTGVWTYGALLLDDVTLDGFEIGLGVQAPPGAALVVRNSSFGACAKGIEHYEGDLWLGAEGDGGENFLGGVSVSGIESWADQPTSIYAVGNTWVPDSQGAVLGQYLQPKLLGGPYGCADGAPRNFCLHFTGPKVQL